MMNFTISSGHSKYVSGAIGILNEVTEARKVTDQVATYLKALGAGVTVYHDNVSRSQAENVNNIVRQHNATARDMDISVHFNASADPQANGVEVCYVNPAYKDEAAALSKAIAAAGGLKDRGAKFRDNLGFLNRTNKPALLIEVCFVTSAVDANLYRKNFDAICRTIAQTLTGKSGTSAAVSNPSMPKSEILSLQKLLNLAAVDPRIDEDGIWGAQTEAAVKQFQRRAGLVVDGIAGPNTLNKLKAVTRENTTKEETPVAEEYKKDAPVSPRFAEAQTWVKEKGISDGTYPQRPVTREEVWSMLHRANKSN